MASYYAQVFFPMSGRCFRMVTRRGVEGGPLHCPQPPVWRGTWRSPTGRRYTVEACDGHRPPDQPPPAA